MEYGVCNKFAAEEKEREKQKTKLWNVFRLASDFLGLCFVFIKPVCNTSSDDSAEYQITVSQSYNVVDKYPTQKHTVKFILFLALM